MLCAYPGPENNMYATIEYNNSIPISGAVVSGFVDYACENQSNRLITTVITPSNGTVGLDCSFCNTFGPFNITVTVNSQNATFFIQTTMKYLGQTTWASIDLTTHTYSIKEFDGSKCSTSYKVSFSNNIPDFYCTSQNNLVSKLNTANFYWLSFLIVPLYAIVRYRKKI